VAGENFDQTYLNQFPDILHGTVINMSGLEVIMEQRKDQDCAVYQHGPVHLSSSRIRVFRKEGENEGENEEAQRESIE